MIRSRQLSSVLFLFLHAPALAQWTDDPALNLAVADAASDQILPKVAPTVDGGAYVSWYDGIANGFDVRLQRLNLVGQEVFPHGGVLVADRFKSSVQDYALDVDANGNALLAYRDDSGVGVQVGAACVSPDGLIIWTVQVTSTSAFVAAPKIAGTADGNAVVAWTQDAETKLQKLNAADGTPLWGAGVTLTPGAGSYSASDLHDAGDDVILAFVHQTGGFGSPRHLLAQKLDSAGNLLWGASHVAVFDGGSLQFGNFPTFVPDGSGGGVFAWYDTAGAQLQSYAQRVLSSGVEAFPHNGVAVSTNATRGRVSPSVDFDGNTDTTFVFWVEQNLSQSQDGVFGQKLDASGARLWTDDGREVVPVGADDVTQVRCRALGGCAFAFWSSAPSFGANQLFGVKLDTAGVIEDGPFDVATTPSSKSRLFAASSTSGYAILAWSDERFDSGDVFAQNVKGDGSLGLGVATPYCGSAPCPCGNEEDGTGCLNTTGSGAELTAFGTTSVTADDLVLTVDGIAPMQFGIIFMGGAQTVAPFGDGVLCVAPGATNINRFPVGQANPLGSYAQGPGLAAFSTANFPVAGHITAGLLAFFQGWYRDPGGPCGQNFNLTQALAVLFTP